MRPLFIGGVLGPGLARVFLKHLSRTAWKFYVLIFLKEIQVNFGAGKPALKRKTKPNPWGRSNKSIWSSAFPELDSPPAFFGESNGTPLQYSCLENPMDGGSWWAAVHGVAKSQTRLSVFTFTFHFHALEKEMATHFSVPAWRIPGTGEPGGLPSLGSHRVGHDWSDLAAAAAFLKDVCKKHLYFYCSK